MDVLVMCLTCDRQWQAQLSCRELFDSYFVFGFKQGYWGQWLWFSWQSGPFQHHRSVVRIQTSAKYYLPIVNRKEENKEKRSREWPGHLKKRGFWVRFEMTF